LADWALARFFARTDRFGGYYVKNGEAHKTARPNKGSPAPFSRDLLVSHFRTMRSEDVLGAYLLTAGEDGVGRFAGADIDAHAEADDKNRNALYAVHLFRKLAAHGFHPLACHWGTGGYHIHTLFDRDVPGPALFAFGRWLVMDATAEPWNFPAAVESFPKQANVPAGKYGNWLRIPGRHHTRNRFPEVFDGTNWIQGEPAVDYVLTLTGDSPTLIPAEALPVTKKVTPPPRATAPRTQPGEDVFAAYSKAATVETVVALHEAAGHTVTNRHPGRVELARNGKQSGLSFSVQDVDGVPVTYNFSTNAGMPDHRGLTPAQVRCLYAAGACDTAAMKRFAAVLRRELGWPEVGTPTSVTIGETVVYDETPAAAKAAPTSDVAETLNADPMVGERFKDTDLANAKRFFHEHNGNAIFVADWKLWAVFDGRRWAVDKSGAVVSRLAHQTLRAMADKAAERLGEAAKKLARAECEAEKAAAEREKAAAEYELNWAKKSQDARKVKAMLEMARSDMLEEEGAAVFDTHPHLLNCENGTVDLRTGERREFQRSDFLTKLCPTPFDPNATCPTYRKFLARVLPQPGAADYARELSGYAVTGEVSDQSVHLFHGSGANGKGVLLDTWTEVLGDGEYAATVPPELIADGGENRHPVEKTVLRGARLAACQETEDGESMNAKRVKGLTGGSRVVARGMRENFYTFAPTHTLVLATNHLPRVRTNDHATWRRIRVMKFELVFWTDMDRKTNPDGDYPEDMRADPLLAAKLKAEAPGILADMVAHAVEFYANGSRLNPPVAVAESVRGYRVNEDVAGMFFNTCVTPDPTFKKRIRGGEFYKLFLLWYKAEIDPNGKDCLGSRTFGEAAEKQYGPKKIGGYMIYPVSVAVTWNPNEQRQTSRPAEPTTEVGEEHDRGEGGEG